MTNDYFLNCLLTFLTGDPGYDLDTKGGGEGGAGGGAFPEVGTDGKALTGLIWGFEALEGTVGLAPFVFGTEGTRFDTPEDVAEDSSLVSSGEAKEKNLLFINWPPGVFLDYKTMIVYFSDPVKALKLGYKTCNISRLFYDCYLEYIHWEQILSILTF